MTSAETDREALVAPSRIKAAITLTGAVASLCFPNSATASSKSWLPRPALILITPYAISIWPTYVSAQLRITAQVAPVEPGGFLRVSTVL